MESLLKRVLPQRHESREHQATVILTGAVAALGFLKTIRFMNHHISRDVGTMLRLYVDGLMEKYPTLALCRKFIHSFEYPSHNECLKHSKLKREQVRQLNSEIKNLTAELWDTMHSHPEPAVRMAARIVIARTLSVDPTIIPQTEDARLGIQTEMVGAPLTFHHMLWPCNHSEEFLLRHRDHEEPITTLPHLEFKIRGDKIALCTKTFRSKNGKIFIRGVWYAFISNEKIENKTPIHSCDSKLTGDVLVPLRSAMPHNLIEGSKPLPDFSDI